MLLMRQLFRAKEVNSPPGFYRHPPLVGACLRRHPPDEIVDSSSHVQAEPLEIVNSGVWQISTWSSRWRGWPARSFPPESGRWGSPPAPWPSCGRRARPEHPRS